MTTENEADTREATGSAVVQLLERVWTRIRADHPELPEVVIVTGSGLVGASKWGHFRANGWTTRSSDHQEAVNRVEAGGVSRMNELFMAGETLAKGSRQVVQTMLHEAAHTLAFVRGVKDTSRQGRWHSKAFVKHAVELGLEHRGATADKTHGYSYVTLTAATVNRYADLMAGLDREIHLMCDLPSWLGGEVEQQGGERIGTAPKTGDEDGKPKSGSMKAVCQCDEPVIIRLSQKTLDLGVVRCDKCDNLFTAAGS